MSTTIHLQGIGSHPSKAAGNVQVGDVLVWNYGYKSEVTSVTRTSPQFVAVMLLDWRSGSSDIRRLKLTRQVAWDRLATLIRKLNVQPNDPTRAGQSASDAHVFGECSRYRVQAVHTRGPNIEWFVFDAERVDEQTGMSAVIRQSESIASAMRGLE